MIIQQQSLMHNPFGLIGACMAHSRGIYAAWTAHKSKHNLAIVYSILKTDYGLSIKSRCPETATQMERDIKEIIAHCMPDTEYEIEQECEYVRVYKLPRLSKDTK